MYLVCEIVCFQLDLHYYLGALLVLVAFTLFYTWTRLWPECVCTLLHLDSSTIESCCHLHFIVHFDFVTLMHLFQYALMPVCCWLWPRHWYVDTLLPLHAVVIHIPVNLHLLEVLYMVAWPFHSSYLQFYIVALIHCCICCCGHVEIVHVHIYSWFHCMT